ncbi:MAG: hypothetical protein QOI43_2298, partial [Gaiellales bacterium]|nr:hypothetical protein [Gaiellales bacterium]
MSDARWPVDRLLEPLRRAVLAVLGAAAITAILALAAGPIAGNIAPHRADAAASTVGPSERLLSARPLVLGPPPTTATCADAWNASRPMSIPTRQRSEPAVIEALNGGVS